MTEDMFEIARRSFFGGGSSIGTPHATSFFERGQLAPDSTQRPLPKESYKLVQGILLAEASRPLSPLRDKFTKEIH
jgi:hypothetical protein